jgi:hypothetical protein
MVKTYHLPQRHYFNGQKIDPKTYSDLFLGHCMEPSQVIETECWALKGDHMSLWKKSP